MADATTFIITSIAAFFSAGLAWFIMSQRNAKNVESARLIGAADLAAAEAREAALIEASNTTKEHMENAFKVVANEAFKNAVADADKSKTQSFDAATIQFSETINKHIETMRAIELKSVENMAKLETKVSAVSEMGINLSQETRDLTNALKADSQAQGAWGELVLENLLQNIGFKEGNEYVKQLSETGSDGKRKRTDFIINLPNKRQIVIDSKVSLKAWDDYIKASTEDDAKAAMKAHCKSIESHAKNLSSKNYEDMESINTLDFVLMFVPLESAFGAAMNSKPELYHDLINNRRVKVVTGSTIVTTLMLIQEIWYRENQSKNQVKLVEEAGKLHDKFVAFLSDFDSVGMRIRQAGDDYAEARKKLTEGTGNIVKRTKDLQLLGAKAKKDIPDEIVEIAEKNHSLGENNPTLVIVEEEE